MVTPDEIGLDRPSKGILCDFVTFISGRCGVDCAYVPNVPSQTLRGGIVNMTNAIHENIPDLSIFY